MAKFQLDLKDIYFNLFDLFCIQQDNLEYDVSDLKQIIEEHTKFCEQELFPSRSGSDQEGVKLTAQGVTVPQSFQRLNKMFYENGWFGLGLPSEWGGTPTPEPVLTSCMSTSTGSNVAWMMYPGLSKATLNIIHKRGTKEQQQLFIPPLFAGKWGGTMCLTEAGAGSDVGALRTQATPIGNGKFKIKGTKIFISSGENDLYENIIHLVLARTPGAVEGTKGLSLFIVPRFKINEDGSLKESNDVLCSKVEEKMGIHASSTCELRFGENDNCVGELIGKEFDGMANMFIMMNEARLMCGIQGESQANLVHKLTEQYVAERAQFGRPIGQHPDVKRTLLKMRAMARGLRSLCLYTSAQIEVAAKGDHRAQSLVDLLTPICKAYSTDEGFKVCVDALQVHGGYGYCHDYGIEQFVRDAKIATIYEGTNGIQAIDFVMRKILKDNGETFKYLLSMVQKTISGLDSQVWSKEVEIFTVTMGKLEKILQKFTQLIKLQQTDKILFHCTDFLTFCGHIVVGWNLARGAELALQRKNNNADINEQEYYHSKIVDFRVFCNQFLLQNLSLAESILSLDFEAIEDRP